jgi:hypothetical protein
MTRRTRHVSIGVLSLGIVALLAAWWQRGDPADRSSARQLPAHSGAKPALPLPAALAPHEPVRVAVPDEPPKSGPERLEWLRMNLGHTYASITLVQEQLKFLRGLSNPNDVQRDALERVQKRLQELREQARRQQDELEHFDVSAPPEVDDHARIGAPIKVSTALSMKRDQWNAIATRYLGPQKTISDATFETLQRELLDAEDELAALRIPAGASTKVQEEFMLVVDALIQAETLRDRSEAQKLLAARWREFLIRARGLSSDRVN